MARPWQLVTVTRALVVLVCATACSFEHGVLATPMIDDATVDMTSGGGDAPFDTAPPADARSCPAAPTSCTAFQCPGSSSCYYLCGTATTGKQSYSGASMSCTNAEVGCVVTINDQAENNCILAATLPAFPDSMVWLGYEQAPGAQEPAGGWDWQCGTSSFVAGNWGSFEPNDDGNGEDCTTMIGGGAWIDATCSGSARFVCELP